MMKSTSTIGLINSNLVGQRDDFLGSGIPYLPLGLASLAAQLKSHNIPIQVVDAFGEAPFRFHLQDNFFIQGLEPTEVPGRVKDDVSFIFVYAWSVMCNLSTKAIIQALKKRFPTVPVAIIENTQAVTGYSLKHAAQELFEAGADYVVVGEPELTSLALLDHVQEGKPLPKGVLTPTLPKEAYQEPDKIQELDSLPWPAWDEFPIKNYWRLRYGHGPVEGRYIPVLTSRGCPFPCRFCVIPATNGRRWRARSAKNTADEMEHWVKTFGVREFHVEDVNPATREKRIIELCEEILQRGLDVKWKLVSGTKIETIHLETLPLMRKAGCNYISFSPETGSPELLKLINKPFKHELALQMTEEMNRLGIRSQACFVLGFPGERDKDRDMTERYIYQLAKAGVDEVALFVVTPIPGTDIFDQFQGYNQTSQFTFSPEWRSDYALLQKTRKRWYSRFIFWKLCFYPGKIIRQALNFLTRKFETKMEMTPYRVLVTKFRLAFGKNA